MSIQKKREKRRAKRKKVRKKRKLEAEEKRATLKKYGIHESELIWSNKTNDNKGDN